MVGVPLAILIALTGGVRRRETSAAKGGFLAMATGNLAAPMSHVAAVRFCQALKDKDILRQPLRQERGRNDSYHLDVTAIRGADSV
jgi:hypothetical protein